MVEPEKITFNEIYKTMLAPATFLVVMSWTTIAYLHSQNLGGILVQDSVAFASWTISSLVWSIIIFGLTCTVRSRIAILARWPCSFLLWTAILLGSGPFLFAVFPLASVQINNWTIWGWILGMSFLISTIIVARTR